MAEKLTKKKVIDQAKREVNKELMDEYLVKYKAKLYEQAKAQKVLDNINRDIEDLELKMEQELG